MGVFRYVVAGLQRSLEDGRVEGLQGSLPVPETGVGKQIGCDIIKKTDIPGVGAGVISLDG